MKMLLVVIFLLANSLVMGAEKQTTNQQPPVEKKPAPLCLMSETLCNEGIFISDNDMECVLYWCPRCERWRERNHFCQGK